MDAGKLAAIACEGLYAARTTQLPITIHCAHLVEITPGRRKVLRVLNGQPFWESGSGILFAYSHGWKWLYQKDVYEGEVLRVKGDKARLGNGVLPTKYLPSFFQKDGEYVVQPATRKAVVTSVSALRLKNIKKGLVEIYIDLLAQSLIAAYRAGLDDPPAILPFVLELPPDPAVLVSLLGVLDITGLPAEFAKVGLSHMALLKSWTMYELQVDVEHHYHMRLSKDLDEYPRDFYGRVLLPGSRRDGS